MCRCVPHTTLDLLVYMMIIIDKHVHKLTLPPSRAHPQSRRPSTVTVRPLRPASTVRSTPSFRCHNVHSILHFITPRHNFPEMLLLDTFCSIFHNELQLGDFSIHHDSLYWLRRIHDAPPTARRHSRPGQALVQSCESSFTGQFAALVPCLPSCHYGPPPAVVLLAHDAEQVEDPNRHTQHEPIATAPTLKNIYQHSHVHWVSNLERSCQSRCRLSSDVGCRICVQIAYLPHALAARPPGLFHPAELFHHVAKMEFQVHSTATRTAAVCARCVRTCRANCLHR